MVTFGCGHCRLALAFVFLASAGMLGAEDNPIAEKPQPVSEPVLRSSLAKIRQWDEEHVNKFLTEIRASNLAPKYLKIHVESCDRKLAAWGRVMQDLPKGPKLSIEECITIKKDQGQDCMSLKGIDAVFPNCLASNEKVMQCREAVMWKVKCIVIDLKPVDAELGKFGVVLSAEKLTAPRLAQMKAEELTVLAAAKGLRQTIAGVLYLRSNGEWMVMPLHRSKSGPFYHVTGFHPAAGNPKALQLGWGTFDTILLEGDRISSTHFVLSMKRTDMPEGGMRAVENAREGQRPIGALIGR